MNSQGFGPRKRRDASRSPRIRTDEEKAKRASRFRFPRIRTDEEKRGFPRIRTDEEKPGRKELGIRNYPKDSDRRGEEGIPKDSDRRGEEGIPKDSDRPRERPRLRRATNEKDPSPACWQVNQISQAKNGNERPENLRPMPTARPEPVSSISPNLD